ncbi:MAG TPA: hypothetical protein VEK11_17665 [Thermoanaerobaculia bacterium]|nr:hypothetical protein [Thermoanaerobaculia bacterium]
MKRLLALLLGLAAWPVAADRLLLPPLLVESRAAFVQHAATDGANFLVLASRDGVYDVLLFDARGHALRAPQLLPTSFVRGVAWAQHYVVFSDEGVLRIANDGTILDATPAPLPFTLRPPIDVVSNGERLLVRGEHQFYFLDSDLTVTELVLPFAGSAVTSFASDGDRFVLLRKVETSAQFTIVDGDGITHVEKPSPVRVARPLLASDGATWAIFDRDADPHLHLFDRELNFTSSKWTSRNISVNRVWGVPGRGYIVSGATAVPPPLSARAFVTEIPAPSYVTSTVIEPTSVRAVAAHAGAVLVAAQSITPMFVGPSLAAWETAPKPVLPGGAVSRLNVDATVNDDGLTLLTWRSPSVANTIYVTRVRRDETIVDAVPLEIAQECGSAPDVASDGHDFLLVWPECGDSFGTAVISPENGLVAQRRLQARMESEVRAVANGTYFGAVWSAFDFGLQRNAIMGLVLDDSGNSVIGTTPQPGTFLGIAPADHGSMLLGFDAAGNVFSQKLDSALSFTGPRHVLRNVSIVSDATFVAALGGFLYVSFENVNAEPRWKLIYLDANGRMTSTALIPADRPTQAPQVYCQPAECTLLTRRNLADGQVLEAASITKNERDELVVGTPRPVAFAAPPHPTAIAPVLFEGTAAAPTRLWYQKFDRATAAFDVFVHEPKTRAVRR